MKKNPLDAYDEIERLKLELKAQQERFDKVLDEIVRGINHSSFIEHLKIRQQEELNEIIKKARERER